MRDPRYRHPYVTPTVPDQKPTPAQMRAQVNDRLPLDGTECQLSASLGGNLFVCANPEGHATWVNERGVEGGHRYVHLTRDEATP